MAAYFFEISGAIQNAPLVIRLRNFDLFGSVLRMLAGAMGGKL